MEKVGLDGTSMRASSGSETVKRTRLVEPSESGMKVISRSKAFRSAYESKRTNRKVLALLICAAAIIIVSAVAVAAFGREAPTKMGIQAAPPVASFIVTSAANASTVAVDASASTSSVGIASYGWVWGDSVISTGVTSSHYYLAGSTYTIILTVTDTLGQTDTMSKQVQVKNGNPPPFPYTVYGVTYASDGVTPLAFCTVNITDVRTGATLIGTVSDGDGAYSADISPLSELTGDDLIATAVGPAGQTGSNTGVVDTSVPYLGIDVTLTAPSIPEFTDIAIPIAGMIAIIAVATVASSRSRDE